MKTVCQQNQSCVLIGIFGTPAATHRAVSSKYTDAHKTVSVPQYQYRSTLSKQSSKKVQQVQNKIAEQLQKGEWRSRSRCPQSICCACTTHSLTVAWLCLHLICGSSRLQPRPSPFEQPMAGSRLDRSSKAQ